MAKETELTTKKTEHTKTKCNGTDHPEREQGLQLFAQVIQAVLRQADRGGRRYFESGSFSLRTVL